MNYICLTVFGLLISWSYICFGTNSSNSSLLSHNERQKNLEKWRAHCGNKTANMKLLTKDVTELNQELADDKEQRIRLRVPHFFGIASDEIITALSESGSWEKITKEWTTFQEELHAYPDSLSPAAKNRLLSIRAEIDQQLFNLSALCPKENRQTALNNFIKKARTEKYLLMVRSTGREDCKELSNAGGNASVTSVQPEESAISDAIKVVLSSYFSEKSIMQRLIGKDTSLTIGKPFMPVLLQFMIGEGSGKYPDEIPRSGVIYSTEGEGNTPGITTIQATFGHNEAVVNGLSPVDTYYISKSMVINPVIRVKKSRLKTVNGELVLVPNARELQRSSTLTAAQTKYLKRVADRLEERYGYPVDIEFVIVKNSIYLVQVRPIEAKMMEPSFLAKEYFDALSGSDTIQGTTIGVGDAKTHSITNSHELIVAENIRKALSEYLILVSKDPENKQRIKSIIVGEMAPSTSHEANQFRGQKKPVLYLQDFGQVKAWIKEKRHLFIDPQRGAVALATSEDQKSAIKDGWFTHPIPQQLSLFPAFFADSKAEIAEHRTSDVPLTQLLEMIKNAPIDIALSACDQLLSKITLGIYKAQKILKQKISAGTETNSQRGQYLENLLHQLYQLIDEQKAVLAQPRFTEIERLYPLNFIYALLTQMPDQSLIANYSLGSILKTEKIEQQALINLNLKGNSLRNYFVQYAKITDFALVDELKDAWQNYLKELVQNEDQTTHDTFAKMIYNLAILDILPLWINTSFAKAVRNRETSFSITESLLAEFNHSYKFLAELKQINDYFKPFPIGSFDEPATFEKQWKLFSDALKSSILSDAFIDRLNSAAHLGKLAAIQTLNTVVAIFDKSIKALTGSTKYTNPQEKYTRVDRFKQMLLLYFDLLETLVTIPFITDTIELLCPENTNLAEYLRNVKGLFIKSPIDEAELIPLPQFNVAGASLGSKSNWERSIRGRSHTNLQPTLENAFSLMHQNLLITLGAIAQKLGIANMAVPPKLNALNAALCEISFKWKQATRKATLIGAIFNKNRLTYCYNLPIKNHSNTFNVIYDFVQKRIYLEAVFIGEARRRWDAMSIVAQALGNALKMPLSKKVELDETKGMLSFGWEIITKKNIEHAPKILKEFAAWSLDTSVPLFSTMHHLNMLEKESFNNAVTSALLDLMLQSPTVLLQSAFVSRELYNTQNAHTVNDIVDALCQTILQTISIDEDFAYNLLDQLYQILKEAGSLVKMPLSNKIISFFETVVEKIDSSHNPIKIKLIEGINCVKDNHAKITILHKALLSKNQAGKTLGVRLAAQNLNLIDPQLACTILLENLDPHNSSELILETLKLWEILRFENAVSAPEMVIEKMKALQTQHPTQLLSIAAPILMDNEDERTWIREMALTALKTPPSQNNSPEKEMLYAAYINSALNILTKMIELRSVDYRHVLNQLLSAMPYIVTNKNIQLDHIIATLLSRHNLGPSEEESLTKILVICVLNTISINSFDSPACMTPLINAYHAILNTGSLDSRDLKNFIESMYKRLYYKINHSRELPILQSFLENDFSKFDLSDYARGLVTRTKALIQKQYNKSRNLSGVTTFIKADKP